MSLAAAVTVIGASLAVLVLVSSLIWVAFALWRVLGRLIAINAGLGLVNEKAAPAGPVVEDINEALAGVDARLKAVLAAERTPKPPPPPAPRVAEAPAQRMAEAPAPLWTPKQRVPAWVVAPGPRHAR